LSLPWGTSATARWEDLSVPLSDDGSARRSDPRQLSGQRGIPTGARIALRKRS
jgi:hypothetical protein